jgi:hypothetical protein
MDFVTLWAALFGTFLGCMIVYGMLSYQLLKMRQNFDNKDRELNLEMMRMRNLFDETERQQNKTINERFELSYRDSYDRIREVEQTISTIWDRIDKVQNRETLIHLLENLGEKKNIRDLVEKHV